MVRVVLDTNVSVSALLGNGKPRRLLVELFQSHELVSSREMLAELADVLSRRKFRLAESQVNEFLLITAEKAEIATIATSPQVIREDRDDNLVLATALRGRAEYVVSGDKRLLRLMEFEGIKIVTVTGMLQLLRKD